MSSASLASVPSVAAAQSVPGGTHRVERRSDFDAQAFAALLGRPAQIRQLYEATSFLPAVLSSIKNSFNGLQFGFGYPAADICIVLAGHGPSSVYGYSDYLWRKYRLGEFFKLADAAGRTIETNVYLEPHAPLELGADPDDEHGMYQDASIATLQRRGMILLTCHTAVEEQARALVQRGFAPSTMTASEVADDVLTHLIDGAFVVPSMVASIAVLQNTYRFAYLTPA